MAITIHNNKMLSVKKEHGALTAQFILDDGSSLKKSILGGLTDDDAAAKAAILARGQELFNNGKEWEENPSTNISTPAKDFLDSLPSLQTAINSIDNNFASLTATDRTILKKMAGAIFALKESL